MKLVCRLSTFIGTMVLAVSIVAPVTVAAEMVKKVDNFIVFLDQSGSMAWAKAEPGQQKFEQAVDAVKRFDQAAPELGYTAATATFAPYKTVANPATYSTGSLSSAVDGISPPFNEMTTMGDGLMAVNSVIGNLSGKTALIMYTDGEANAGADAVTAARNLYDTYGGNLCIHVVSYADTPQGQATIDAIRALSGCSIVVEAKALESDAAMAQFAKDVLYEEKQAPPPPKPAPAPAPAPAPVAKKEVITFNLLFDFDKSNIKDEMIPVLEQAKLILEEDPGSNFVVSGHADATGPEDYNQGLSERRAASVKNWLVNHGISASRLETVGYGETRPKYDNSTREGRKLNRRVELQSK